MFCETDKRPRTNTKMLSPCACAAHTHREQTYQHVRWSFSLAKLMHNCRTQTHTHTHTIMFFHIHKSDTQWYIEYASAKRRAAAYTWHAHSYGDKPHHTHGPTCSNRLTENDSNPKISSTPMNPLTAADPMTGAKVLLMRRRRKSNNLP